MSNQRHLIQNAMQQAERAKLTSLMGSETRALDLKAAAKIVAFETPELPGYTVEGEIHRGGQGVVFRGIQHATGRSVAIKMMHGGALATESERHRFDQEVRVLAEIRHPNIVTIHDSGVVGGVAYYVMDLVAGEPLHRYAELKQPTIRQRIELLMTIAEAVNAAHLNGVIHRDLKPGNICVRSDRQPVVLDFGLAKRTSRTLSMAQDQVTETGAFVGSLPWASPEQAEGEANIDVRTDVYSLGVVAYQLLTGEFPYDVMGSITQTARTISTVDPTPPRVVNPSIDDEVATILMKALRKPRVERYQNAGELSRDFARYLAGEPIEAKGDSIGYWLKKKLIQHKVAAGLIAAITSIVTIGFIVSTYFWQVAESARQVAGHQKAVAEGMAEKAQEEAARATAVSEFLVDVISASDPEKGGRSEITVQDVLSEAVEELDSGSLDAQPSVEASVRAAVARSYESLALYKEARQQSEVAARLYAGTDDTEGQIMAQTHAGHMLTQLERLDEAIQRFDEFYEDAREAFGEGAKLALVLQGRSRALKALGRVEEAEQDLRQAISFSENDARVKSKDLATLHNDLSVVLTLQGKHQQALEQLRAGLQRLSGRDSQKYLELSANSNLAMDLARQRQFAKAEQLLQSSIDGLRKLAGPRSPVIASCLATMGNVLGMQNRHAEGLPYFTESLSIREELLGKDHPLVANSKNGLAIIAYQAGDLDLASEYFQDAIRIYTTKRGPDHPKLATILQNFAAVERAAGRLEESLALCRRALEINESQFGRRNLKTADSLNRIGRLLQETEQPEQAAGFLNEALSIRKALSSEDSLLVAETQDYLALTLADLGQLEEALQLSEEAYTERKKKMKSSDPLLADSLFTIASIHEKQGEVDRAVQLYREALQGMEQIDGGRHWRLGVFRAHWARALAKAGKRNEAQAAIEQALEGIRGRSNTPASVIDKVDVIATEIESLLK